MICISGYSFASSNLLPFLFDIMSCFCAAAFYDVDLHFNLFICFGAIRFMRTVSVYRTITSWQPGTVQLQGIRQNFGGDKSINLCQTILCHTYFYYKSKPDDRDENERMLPRLCGVWARLYIQLATLSNSIGILRPFQHTYFPFYCSVILHICILVSMLSLNTLS